MHVGYKGMEILLERLVVKVPQYIAGVQQALWPPLKTHAMLHRSRGML
jgi:hypothetical protein